MQSVAGLAAQAVNAKTHDELVWVVTGSPEFEGWYDTAIRNQSTAGADGDVAVWDLIDRYKKTGLIKGYILYRRDTSAGELNDHRPQIDCSVNVATSLSGLLGGLIVDERLESEAKAHGLSLLVDARDKTQTWCFGAYRDKFNRQMLCAQDPKKPHVRDLAIAQRAFTFYGGDEILEQALEWLEPLSPILGWNGGDEFRTTQLTTFYGHIQTATDWCMNLPVLMAGSRQKMLPKLPSLDPRTIDWTDRRHAVSFVGTDGDNVQWLEGNFFRDPSYWANPERGKFPFGWSCCFAHLTQICPTAIDYALRTRTPNDSFIEWGGGYYYPDQFGSKRANGRELLAAQARRTWNLMKQTNTTMIGFNVAKIGSPEALRAYQTFAGETDGLLAILAFQYNPYEGGAGKTFWVKDRLGIEIPVITAGYSIWENVSAKKRPLAGTPAKVARLIREVDQAENSQQPRYDWVIAHVWSYFRPSSTSDDDSENLPQTDAPMQGAIRGLTPVSWCVQRLPKQVRVVSPEELAWRIRMQYNPTQTKTLIGQ
jgi:hypothetical protein